MTGEARASAGPVAIDLDHLLKLRLVVARYGEMDLARWWNTKGQLGRMGGLAVRRGLPRTHRFAQARSVFAVAAHRCAEVFDPPRSATLWSLPGEVEEELEERWEHWLDHVDLWSELFGQLEQLQTGDLLASLGALELITPREAEATRKLKRSAEGRAVALPGLFRCDRSTLVLLAAGFSRGEVGALAVPYARLEA